jgi:hypothetical protein
MEVWLVDPSEGTATSGPPDAEVANDLADKIRPLKAKGGRGRKDHKIERANVVSTESTDTLPPAP